MTRQYIVQFDSAKLPRIDTDFLVIGDGNAGITAAIEANQHGDVLLITKRAIEESNVPCSQEGVAAIVNENDNIASHVENTLNAGKGLCDQTTVEVMIEEGFQQVLELIQRSNHSGKEEESLRVNPIEQQEQIRVINGAFAIDFMTHGNECYGAVALIDDVLHCIFAKATILASGGLAHIYQGTSNPNAATGDGFAAAWRAGCQMIDMEFLQFHPTILFLMDAPYFLIDDRMREEGGTLINSRGERFMRKYHEMEELAPGDIIGRAILNEIELTGSPCVYLDITHLTSDAVRSRFSKTYQFCHQFGLDITTDVIPVSPGVDFMIGGVRTNLNAETNIQGLYACGENACTGLHGANRTGSNPLLESIVFGVHAGRAAVKYARTIEADSYVNLRISSDDGSIPHQTLDQGIDIEAAKESVQEMMSQYVGLVKHGAGLEAVADELRHLDLNSYWCSSEAFEFQNMRDAATLITEASILRTESRGTHYREDFPEQDDVRWKKHIVLQRGHAPRIVG